MPTATGRRRRGSAIVPAKSVERVFDDIVTGSTDDVQEQLANEFGQAKARSDFAAVEHNAAGCRPAAFAPFGKYFAGLAE